MQFNRGIRLKGARYGERNLENGYTCTLKASLIGAAAGLVAALIGRIPHVSIGTATCVRIATLRIEELIQTLKAKYTIVTHNMHRRPEPPTTLPFS
jgi:hypothetical protein